MPGHNNENALGSLLKFRVESDLKVKIASLAKRKRKTSAQLMRETLWEIVDKDERNGGQEELPLVEAEHRG